VPVQLTAGVSEPSAPNGTCTTAKLSASARIVTFTSEATNLLPEDTDTIRDIVVVNLRKGTGELVSKSTEGVKANLDCEEPVLDAPGKRVAFTSLATNLVADDLNAQPDIFLRDLRKQTTIRVSVASDGTESNGRNMLPAISGNGQVVTFTSLADNLVAGDTNGVSDVFVHDLRTGETRLVSASPDGAPTDGESFGSALSGNGRFVAFLSVATNLGPAAAPQSVQAYVRDMLTGETKLASKGLEDALADGDCKDVSISSNGRRVGFTSAASNLVTGDGHPGLDIFLRDMKKGTTRLISTGMEGAPANADSRRAILSRNGRWMASTSDASNLVPGDGNGFTDVFRWGLKRKQVLTDRVSISSEGEEGDGNSENPSLQRNGRYVTFSTRASNLFQASPTDGVWVVAMRRP
jgi:Tol biopolymer transport system component